MRFDYFFYFIFIVQICFGIVNSLNLKLKRKLYNVGIPPNKHVSKSFPDMWFLQKLNHFSPIDETVWKQRYFENRDYFNQKSSNLVFLMIGGEGEISAEWMNKGQWIEYAKQFEALCYQLEHRYYGKSHPTEDMGNKNMIYLTSEQALADLANFIMSINEQNNFDNNVKWILFGGSYPGSLAAWMRLKYPHLVYAAISSSGPLLAKTDFMEYFTVVIDALRTSSDDCVNEIKEAYRQLGVLLGHRIGQRRVTSSFKLCDTIEGANNLDITSFYETISSTLAGVVQYNKDNRIGESKNLANITIDIICRYMTDRNAGSQVDRLSNFNALLLTATNEQCLDYNYNKSINEYRNISWNSPSAEGGRQWIYQTCNEFGFFQTSEAVSDIFGNKFPLNYFIQMCIDIFGNKFNLNHINSGVEHTNMMYGALNIQTSRIVFIHGSIDPWHALGIIKTQDQNTPVIYITGTAHCANMYPSRDDDIPDLRAAREQIKEFIDTWSRQN